jgi:hypothetical protein
MILGILPLLGNACSKFVAGDYTPLGSQVAFGSGITAFRSGFYSFAQAQGCVQCHGDNVHPRFASPDIIEAYAEAKGMRYGSNVPIINFSSPSSSVILEYSGNNHCSATPCSNPVVRSTVQTHLRNWAIAELGGEENLIESPVQPVNYVTEAVAAPSPMPTLSAAPAMLRFNLSKLSPAVAALGGAVFEIQIQKANATEYRITAPRLVGNSAAVNLRGIHVFVRSSSDTGYGSEDPAQGLVWTEVTMTIAPSALPNPLPAGALAGVPLSTITLNIQAQSASDVFMIGFDQLR